MWFDSGPFRAQNNLLVKGDVVLTDMGKELLGNAYLLSRTQPRKKLGSD